MIIISKYYKLYYKNKKGVQTSLKNYENYFLPEWSPTVDLTVN